MWHVKGKGKGIQGYDRKTKERNHFEDLNQA